MNKVHVIFLSELELLCSTAIPTVLVARSWVSATKCGRLAKKCGVKKNRFGHNFQNIASKTNQRWVINYDKPLIHFGTDILKIVAVLIFFNTA